MAKFLRNYTLSVQTNDPVQIPSAGPPYLVIQNPFTVEFDVQRNVYGSANTFSIRIYNLSAQNRNRILKDYWTFDINRKVFLQAGYANGLPLPEVLNGYIDQCWSVREGNNFITQIIGRDGGYVFSQASTDKLFVRGTTKKEAIGKVMHDLTPYGVRLGTIGEYQGSFTKDTPMSGSTTKLLSGKDLTNGGFFIDLGIANAIADNEHIDTPVIPTITPATGLLNTPTFEETVLKFDMIFEPTLQPGQLILLQSVTGVNFNGKAKILNIHHHGTISDAVCGDAVTSITVSYGPQGTGQ